MAAELPESWFINRAPLAMFTSIGVVSYSLYLIHQPLLLVTEPLIAYLHLSIQTSLLFFFVVEFPILVLLASLLFRTVEEPFMKGYLIIEFRRPIRSESTIDRC